MELLNKNNISKSDHLIDISEGYKHSIHPIYLNYEMHRSLKRLKRDYIDCYLLHNPEYHFRNEDASQDRYYEKIFRAFQFLEEKVKEEVLRYYGISSNTFPFSYKEKRVTKLNKVIEVAERISFKHHFKFIQFPFNIVENNAIIPHHYNSDSSISLSKKNNIITLSNRPLNANTQFGVRRLAYYDESFSEDEFKDSMGNLFLTIKKKLDKEDYKEKVTDFEIFDFLQKNYVNINDHKIQGQLNEMLNSFIEVLYKNDIPKESKKNIKAFKKDMEKWSRKQSSYETKKLLKSLNIEINSDKVSYLAIKRYLSDGIDHVLCGMKKRVMLMI